MRPCKTLVEVGVFDPIDVLVFSMHTPFLYINDTLVCPHILMLCVEESMSERVSPLGLSLFG